MSPLNIFQFSILRLDDNEDGYKKGSVIEKASNLRNDSLLLMHGTLCVSFFKTISLVTSFLVRDMNVHYQNSLLFVAALQKAETRFEMSFYPDVGHGLRNRHASKTMDDFIVKCLLK